MKRIALWLALALLMLGGCAADTTQEALHIVVATQAFDDQALARFEAQIESELPQLGDIRVTGVRMGAYSAQELMHVCALIEEKSIDLFIADEVCAKRAGDSGDSYHALDALFTQDELDAWGLECVSVPVVGMDGKLTGEESAPCGVMLGAGGGEMLSLSDMRMFIVSNTTRQDAAEVLFAHLAQK